jgi:hypothetical protein
MYTSIRVQRKKEPERKSQGVSERLFPTSDCNQRGSKQFEKVHYLAAELAPTQ